MNTTAALNSSPDVAILEARSLIRARIEKQAMSEGEPLTELESRMLDSDRLSKEEDRRALDQIEKEDGWQEFMGRISGLLSRAIEEDSKQNSSAAQHFDELVHRLESSAEDFTLWVCCVPAIPGYKATPGSVFNNVLVVAVILAVIGFIVAKALIHIAGH